MSSGRHHGGGYGPAHEKMSQESNEANRIHETPGAQQASTGRSYQVPELHRNETSSPQTPAVEMEVVPRPLQLQGQVRPSPYQGSPEISYSTTIGYQTINSSSQLTKTQSSKPTYSSFLSTPAPAHERKPQNGVWNILSPGSNFRWKKSPHVFKSPSTKDQSKVKYRHRDFMSRVLHRPSADRYLHSQQGSLSKLMVQTVDEIYNATGQEHSWRRTYVRKIGPYMMRAAYMPFKEVPSSYSDLTVDHKKHIALWWLPACMVLFYVLPLPKLTGDWYANGGYPQFPYRYWGMFKVARNPREDVRTARALHWNTSTYDNSIERILRPAYLMFLNDPRDNGAPGCKRISEDDWNRAQNDSQRKLPPYLFAAYTKEQFSDDSDLDALLKIAEKATRRAGLTAFWIGCSCMPAKDTLEEDVYRINDVIRGAHSMVIIVGAKDHAPEEKNTDYLLSQWGSRMWTFPEALLSPNDKAIEVYTRYEDLNRPLVIAKKTLPARIWNDNNNARQLMDHFQGTLTLSRLELVSLAIKCLHTRETDTYLPGDMAYVLQGLLRRRPMVDASDSEFQALARLSLANDNDLLLERLISLLPKSFDEKWLRADDAFDVNLWDIFPSCQVAAVGNSDTVVLDGCRAAAIKWDKFEPVATKRKFSWKRFWAVFFLRSSPIQIIIGILLAIFKLEGGVAALFLVVGLIIWLLSPFLVKIMYSGKFWNQQAFLFGFEGYMDIATIESCIFGYNMKRLKWTPCGSPLSRHSVGEFGEWIGRDPSDDPSVAQIIQAAATSAIAPGQPRIFTIIDTFTMTATLIQAQHPPAMALICASEGGMQRAVLCSYEWKTQTLYKETVIRMPTQVLDRMSRIGRVNFGFFRGRNMRTVVEGV